MQERGSGPVSYTHLDVYKRQVFCFSAFQLFKILKGYHDGRSEYDKVRKLAVEEKKSAGEDQFSVNFDELMQMNPDTIGWIRFHPEPSQISYPIVKGKDNSEYLKKTFSANENTLGACLLYTSRCV